MLASSIEANAVVKPFECFGLEAFPPPTWAWDQEMGLFPILVSIRNSRCLLVLGVIVSFFLCLAIYTGGYPINMTFYSGWGQLRRLNESMIPMVVPDCGCQKWVPAPTKFDDGINSILNRSLTLKDTTCQDYVYARGLGQKVIAFTFYEPPVGPEKSNMNSHEQSQERSYRGGIEENLELIKEMYPGWTMRLYYQIQEGQDELRDWVCRLVCKEPMLDVCDATKNPKLGDTTKVYPLIWRFFPAIDMQVDYFFSRDLDSRINRRELAAVEEFLNSNKDFHVMRDHPSHGVPILGGTLGMKVLNQRKDIILSYKKMFKDPSTYKSRDDGGGFDQVAITNSMWSWAKTVLMSHDSYTCSRFPSTKPFPVRREPNVVGNYVGSVIKLNASIGQECPVMCRPLEHRDWTLC